MDLPVPFITNVKKALSVNVVSPISLGVVDNSFKAKVSVRETLKILYIMCYVSTKLLNKKGGTEFHNDTENTAIRGAAG